MLITILIIFVLVYLIGEQERDIKILDDLDDLSDLNELNEFLIKIGGEKTMEYKTKYFEVKAVYDTGIAIKQHKVFEEMTNGSFDNVLFTGKKNSRICTEIVCSDILNLDILEKDEINLEFRTTKDIPDCFTDAESMEHFQQFISKEHRDSIFNALVEAVDVIEDNE